MNVRKLKNIDCCKCIALLLILIYHYWTLSGSKPIPVSGIDTIVMLGGEIGVTMFFVLSGFGNYFLLKNKETLNWYSFIASRYRKMAPLYYISILFVIAFTLSGAVYFSISGVADIIAHLLFIHNFTVRFHGSINGALWTMGVIFQYYLIAMIIYKCMKKNKHITVLLSIVFTIVIKMLLYREILPADGTMYFIYGRQIVTTLDNFVIGMYIGSLIYEDNKKLSKIKGGIYFIVMMAVLILWGKWGLTYGVYVDHVRGYIWHSVLAIILAGIIYIMGLMGEAHWTDLLQWIGVNEYGIYLLHLPILQNMLQAPLIQQFNSRGLSVVGCICYLFIALTVGYFFNHLLDRSVIGRI